MRRVQRARSWRRWVLVGVEEVVVVVVVFDKEVVVLLEVLLFELRLAAEGCVKCGVRLE